MTYKMILSSTKFSLPISRHPGHWWIEIRTNSPCCTYFFGPFDNYREAKRSQDGYIEDLVEEKAFGITVEIKQCQPSSLTIFAESDYQQRNNIVVTDNQSISEAQNITSVSQNLAAVPDSVIFGSKPSSYS